MKNLMVVLIGVMVFASCQMPMGPDTSSNSSTSESTTEETTEETAEETVVVESVSIEYDGSTIYTQSVDLPVTVVYSDGTTEETVETFTATEPGIVNTFTHTVEEVVDSVDVDFEDWRLVGEWYRTNQTISEIFSNDGRYTIANGIQGEGVWFTESDSEGKYLTRDGNTIDNYHYYFEDENTLKIWKFGPEYPEYYHTYKRQ